MQLGGGKQYNNGNYVTLWYCAVLVQYNIEKFAINSNFQQPTLIVTSTLADEAMLRTFPILKNC